MLNSFTRESVIEIALGVYLNDPLAIANGLGRLIYPEQEVLWNNFIVKLTQYMKSPSVQQLDRDERITQILKYITGTFDLPSAKDILIFFRAKGLFDGIFKYLENNYGPALKEYGCPIPKTNALARNVAFWNAKNLYNSIMYGRRPIINMIYNRFTFFPRFFMGLFWNSSATDEITEEEESLGNEIAPTNDSVVPKTVESDVVIESLNTNELVNATDEINSDSIHITNNIQKVLDELAEKLDSERAAKALDQIESDQNTGDEGIFFGKLKLKESDDEKNSKKHNSNSSTESNAPLLLNNEAN